MMNEKTQKEIEGIFESQYLVGGFARTTKEGSHEKGGIVFEKYRDDRGVVLGVPIRTRDSQIEQDYTAIVETKFVRGTRNFENWRGCPHGYFHVKVPDFKYDRDRQEAREIRVYKFRTSYPGFGSFMNKSVRKIFEKDREPSLEGLVCPKSEVSRKIRDKLYEAFAMNNLKEYGVAINPR